MYKGIINKEQTVTSDTNIPFVTALNTNSNTTVVNNSVQINNTGYYNIKVNAIVTDTGATPVILNVIANGNVISSATSDITTGTGTDTISINDVIRVVVAPNTDRVALSVQINTTGSIEPYSTFIVEKVR